MNSERIKTDLIREMRQRVASVISDAKAYNVPALCERLGLEAGTEEEAYSSKYKYAQKRLARINAAKLVPIARELLVEESSHSLSEVLAKYDEADSGMITDLTRKRLISIFDGRPLSTEIDQIELLERVWPRDQMMPATDPSNYDRSLKDALIQHTVRNDDWSNRDIFDAIGLSTCSRAKLFRFLEEVTNPIAQTTEGQITLVAAINEHLKHDGYTLTEDGKLSGSPLYVVKPLKFGSPSDASISAILAAFDPDEVHARWTAALERREGEPQGAITLARTLLEDVCKWILDEANEPFKDDDDLPTLYRKLAKVLKLAPDDHTEQVFKQILGSCQSVVESLGALRNKLGDAHSLGRKRARPQARHAELAVNLSGAMATFLVSTWKARQTKQTKS